MALALQVGVNYANDYSDGIRGTDVQRVGPVRLVGQELATPGAVKRAALMSFAVAGVAGLALVYITGLYWLIVVGAAAIAAAWFYTGGPRPYGYAGLGEVFVFVSSAWWPSGTAVLLDGSVTLLSFVVAIPVGLLACALLVANNLRDIPTDIEAGKHTLAARLGDERTRRMFLAMVWVPFLIVLAMSIAGSSARPGRCSASLPWCRFRSRPHPRGRSATAPAPAVDRGPGETARLELVFSLLLAAGMALSAPS